MTTPNTAQPPLRRPTLRQLGDDLTNVSTFRRWFSVSGPFLWCAGYWAAAGYNLWPVSVLCLMALSFVTYGSVSHDLVHRNLGLRRDVNDRLLVLIELLTLRSGTAYRLAHLHHHRRYPAHDDVEGAAARMTLTGALLEGIGFQAKLFRWAWTHHPDQRRGLGLEMSVIVALYVASVALVPWTIAPIVYSALITMGAWIIPVITSWIPHVPDAPDEVHQTRVFRGRLFSVIAVEHLYHLEHHLYPAVPHHNWPELAKRLDPFLREAEVTPIRLLF